MRPLCECTGLIPRRQPWARVFHLDQVVAQRAPHTNIHNKGGGAFLIGVVDRELECGERQDENQRCDLQVLLGRKGSISDLYQQFCQQVRRGELDEQWPAAFEFAFKQVIDKVSVTNPDYLAAMHRSD